MPDLIAQGSKPDHCWRRKLPEGQSIVLGRESPPWSVAWDNYVSRRHAKLTWKDGQLLLVEKLPSGRNPIYLRGQAIEQFEVKPGEMFLIGETTFSVADDSPRVSMSNQREMVHERAFSPQELSNVRVHDAGHQLDVLSRLPEMISGAANEQELCVRLVEMLLAGVTEAEAVGLVRMEGSPTETGTRPPIRVLHWDRRKPGPLPFHPSARLVAEALRRQETVVYVWTGKGNTDFTHSSEADWAFCTPVRGESDKGWAIYGGGRFSGSAATEAFDPRSSGALVDDLKFTGLVAAIWGSLRQVKTLQHRQASLGQFFSPAVTDMLATADPEEVLKPRTADVTVLFCDLRGFTRESEKSDLLPLLEGVSNLLGVMTQHILSQGGVIGDFHGDAAMGFWGWPIAQPDAVQRACQAALGIRAAFEKMPGPGRRSAGLRAGIGIATGLAVAGKIGTTDQVKVTVFGPVVNLASRLEGMTKIMGVPILLDEATAAIVKEKVPAKTARARRLAKVRPYGLESALMVSELLPPAAEYSVVTDAHLELYEKAVDSLLEGEWVRSFEYLHQMPTEDLGKDYLTAYILANKRTPPPDWDGVIRLTSKS